MLKLQQKVNELNAQNEDLKDEKKHLSLKIKEIESELEVNQNIVEINIQQYVKKIHYLIKTASAFS